MTVLGRLALSASGYLLRHKFDFYPTISSTEFVLLFWWFFCGHSSRFTSARRCFISFCLHEVQRRRGFSFRRGHPKLCSFMWFSKETHALSYVGAWWIKTFILLLLLMCFWVDVGGTCSQGGKYYYALIYLDIVLYISTTWNIFVFMGEGVECPHSHGGANW